MASASTNLCDLNNGKTVFATATGIKLGAKGHVTDPAEFMAPLSKGERRRIRKAAHRNGRTDISTAGIHPVKQRRAAA